MPIFSLSDPVFWLQFLYYFFAVFIAYFIPGSLLLRRVVMPKIFHTTVSIVLGMVLFAYQGYILGYLHLREGTYVYLVICFLLWLRNLHKSQPQTIKQETVIPKPAWAVIVIGTCMQLSTVWFTGVIINGNAYYCCGNANDNFLYGSLSRQIIHSIPPEHPGMSGEEFKNYHYWSNIVIGETSRIFRLPPFQTQFQYSTALISMGMGILFMALLWQAGAGRILSIWSVFFFYFGSDAIYWVIAALRSAPLFSMSSLEDGPGFLANFPRAMAVLVGVAAMVLLQYARKKPGLLTIIATSMLFASVAGMKIYVAFFMYIGILCLSLYDLIKKKSYISTLVGFVTLALVIPVYLQTNGAAGGLYYLGFWRAQNFIVQPWLNLIRLEQARIIYETDHKWLQVAFYNILFTGIYCFAIYGTKMLALLNTKHSLKQIPVWLHIFLIPGILSSFLLGFFYNQDTGESNTFNFLVTVFIFLSIYAASVMSYAQMKLRTFTYSILAIIIIILTVPRPIYRTFRNFSDIYHKKSFSVSGSILEAAAAIRQGTDKTDVILINSKYFTFDTEGPVFSMIMDRPMYYSGEQFLYWFKASPAEVAERKMISKIIFNSRNIIEVAGALKQSKISYIVDAPSSLIGSTTSAAFLKTFYKNNDIHVIKVDFQ